MYVSHRASQRSLWEDPPHLEHQQHSHNKKDKTDGIRIGLTWSSFALPLVKIFLRSEEGLSYPEMVPTARSLSFGKY
jgi:hypothetical protein